MIEITNKVLVLTGYTPESLTDTILTSPQPLLLKGFVNGWPAVQAGKQSPLSLDHYLKPFSSNKPVVSFQAAPELKGRYFYNETLTDINFTRAQTTVNEHMASLLDLLDNPNPPAHYVNSETVDLCFPGFRTHNNIDFLNQYRPLVSYFLGNHTRVAAHWDMPDNIACVIAGKRRFTLFPPDQVDNLYVGPIDFVPANQPVSLVDIHNPDFDQFPRYKEALKHAIVADMEPGDALFLPSMWWHDVESFDTYNMMVNYWWKRTPRYLGSPKDALDHAIFSIRDLPDEQRKAWCALFKHYVFEADTAITEHLPEEAQGRLAEFDEVSARRARAMLINNLNR